MGIRMNQFSWGQVNLIRPVFIETGTYKGETLENARRAGYGLLFSIECVPDYYTDACEKFKKYPNVTIWYGSSPDILPKIVTWITPSVFWLDAHFQGGDIKEQAYKHGQCPLLAELAVIFSKKWMKLPIILIDDAHMFLKTVPTNFESLEWPTYDEIKDRLPPGYSVSGRIEKNKLEVGPWPKNGEDNVLYCIPDAEIK